MNYLPIYFTQFEQRFFQKASFLYLYNKLPWIIISFGIILRFAQYIYNRSLWLDEASLALNIVNRPFSELLFKPLEFGQAAPLGFLAVEKVIIFAFGNSEYTLRLFPFLAGIISLFLFYGVAKRFIRPRAIPIALGLFAITEPLIYYSSEVKQYSSDVAIALLIYFVIFYIKLKRLTISRVVLLGIIGTVAIWLSHPAVFILAGVGVVLALSCLEEKDRSKLFRLSIIYSIWITSFIMCYFVSLVNPIHNEGFIAYWSKGFMPFPPISFQEAKWFVNTFFNIFENPVGLSLPGIAALSFLTGCFSMFQEKRKEFFFLVTPILFVLLASGIHDYPFQGRLLLFIVPLVLLIVAEGTEQIRLKTSHESAIIGITVIGLLFFYPLLGASYELIKPLAHEEIKPAINFIREHKHNKDIVYLYYASKKAFKYYSKNFGFTDNDYIIGVNPRNNWKNCITDLREASWQQESMDTFLPCF